MAVTIADGEAVEPLNRTLSRDDGAAFYQSVAAEPGECLTVCSAFHETTDPTQMIHRPGNRYRGYAANCTAFDIGGIQETMLT